MRTALMGRLRAADISAVTLMNTRGARALGSPMRLLTIAACSMLALWGLALSAPDADALNGCTQLQDPWCPGAVCWFNPNLPVQCLPGGCTHTDCCTSANPPFWCPPPK